jgi:hypothetical protein
MILVSILMIAAGWAVAERFSIARLRDDDRKKLVLSPLGWFDVIQDLAGVMGVLTTSLGIIFLFIAVLVKFQGS